jgi:hypothetical protein
MLKKKFALLLVVITVIMVMGCSPTQGLKGEKGDTGIQGLQGERGLKGEQGNNGLQGSDGGDGIIWGEPITITRNISFVYGGGVGEGAKLNVGDRLGFKVYTNLPSHVYVVDNFGNMVLSCNSITTGFESNSAGSIIAASNGEYIINIDVKEGFYHPNEIVKGTLTYSIYPNKNN